MIRLLWAVAWACLVLSVFAAGSELAAPAGGGAHLRFVAVMLAAGVAGFCVFGALARNLELLTRIERALATGGRG